MKREFFLKLLLACFILSFAHHSRALTFDDLRPDAPLCKKTPGKVPSLPPKLPGESKNWDTDQEIFVDFNGDGWCDYALGVPYPVNSKMSSFGIEEMIRLGSAKGWQPVLRGKKWVRIDEGTYSARDFPLFQIDLTDIHLVYPKSGGAPYVLGLWGSGTDDPWRQNPNPPHCREYSTAYRWDETVGAFRRVDDATAKVVAQYYYAFIAKPCLTENECRAFASCRFMAKPLDAESGAASRPQK